MTTQNPIFVHSIFKCKVANSYMLKRYLLLFGNIASVQFSVFNVCSTRLFAQTHAFLVFNFPQLITVVNFINRVLKQYIKLYMYCNRCFIDSLYTLSVQRLRTCAHT